MDLYIFILRHSESDEKSQIVPPSRPADYRKKLQRTAARLWRHILNLLYWNTDRSRRIYPTKSNRSFEKRISGVLMFNWFSSRDQPDGDCILYELRIAKKYLNHCGVLWLLSSFSSKLKPTLKTYINQSLQPFGVARLIMLGKPIPQTTDSISRRCIWKQFLLKNYVISSSIRSFAWQDFYAQCQWEFPPTFYFFWRLSGMWLISFPPR